MQSVESIQRDVGAQDDRSDRVEQLLRRCAMRDEQALDELYALVSAQLFGLLLRMLRSQSLAEDALQDVMVRVWQHAERYAAYRGRAMAWLLSIARYRAIDMMRTQREYASLDDVPIEALTDSSSEDPTDSTTSHRLRAALMDCWGRLSADQRRCIELAYVDGYSHEEMAKKLESPVGTVKSWLRRGLVSLKRCMRS